MKKSTLDILTQLGIKPVFNPPCTAKAKPCEKGLSVSINSKSEKVK